MLQISRVNIENCLNIEGDPNANYKKGKSVLYSQNKDH